MIATIVLQITHRDSPQQCYQTLFAQFNLHLLSPQSLAMDDFSIVRNSEVQQWIYGVEEWREIKEKEV